jgi:hypothetical protein
MLQGGWLEAYLGGRWYIFDPRNNISRIGRVLIARGRDAVDIAITTTFGPNLMVGFMVRTDGRDCRTRLMNCADRRRHRTISTGSAFSIRRLPRSHSGDVGCRM